MERILFVVNSPDFFLSHRLRIANEARRIGYDVHVATPYGEAVKKISAKGFHHHRVPIARSGQNPLVELISFSRLLFLFWRLNPHLVHLVTIKPVLYGGIAARLVKVHAVVAAISGLGTAFTKRNRVARARFLLVSLLYRLALQHDRLAVIFQNSDDRNALLAVKELRPNQIRIIRGSGVDLREYVHLGEPEGKPVVVMAARLLRDKGVFEFVQAAKLLKSRGVEVRMRLIGSPDPGNPASVAQDDLDQWANEEVIEILGFRPDIAAQYAASNIVCLPSYYGEGLPKTLVEAAACGRVVVTTNHPGCRDAIKPNISGILVPVKDAFALADAIQELLGDPERRARMGAAGRKLAEKEFAVESIVEQHLAIYKGLLEDA